MIKSLFKKISNWFHGIGPNGEIPCPIPWPECHPGGCSRCEGKGSYFDDKKCSVSVQEAKNCDIMNT